jgi:hypothetical protein
MDGESVSTEYCPAMAMERILDDDIKEFGAKE